MTEKIQKVSSSNRTHIGFFGRMNAGKSTLINALTGQHTSIVSDLPGTTADVVRKPMEIHGIGACVLLDTAGVDDTTAVGKMRVEASRKAAGKTDIAVVVFYDEDESVETGLVREFQQKGVPVIGVLSHYDILDYENAEKRIAKLEKELRIPVLPFGGKEEELSELRGALVKTAGKNTVRRTPLAGLVKEGDIVLLVMPQDPQAPEGRLIQPETQSIRDALDRECVVICTTLRGMEIALNGLKEPPQLVVTDSQVFKEVHRLCPKESRLTSFSILFAALKGDIEYLAESAKAIESLTDRSRVLIAECCTHVPMEDDIGREKIPRLLRKYTGCDPEIHIKAGTDFPEDASSYNLIIQCGGCMFNRRYILSRIAEAKRRGVPMTNYGIAIAYMNKILEKVTLPEGQKDE